MKYYVAEMLYNKDGDLIKKDRITGDITDLKWAQQQMNHRFHEKLKQNRDSIGPGDIEITSKKCTIHQEQWDYIVEIISLENHCTANEILLAIAEQHRGDWAEILKAVERKDFPEDLAVMANLSGKPAITILDQKYPESLRTQLQPPFALFYEGDINLLGSKNYTRLAIGCGRNCSSSLKTKAIKDIAKLPKKYIIVTSDPDIINDCLVHNRKIILVKPCGISQQMPRVTTRQENMIIQKGGLVITEYPDSVETTAITCRNRLRIICAMCDGLFIIQCERASGTAMLVTLATINGKDVMVYPTFPEFHNTMNNELIADGAILVENDEDIMLHLS